METPIEFETYKILHGLLFLLRVLSYFKGFLPRDATHSTVMPQYRGLSSVRPYVTFRYCDHIGWNTSKIISQLISLRFMLGLTPSWVIWSNGNNPKFRVEWPVSVGNNSMHVAYLTEFVCIEA